MIVAFTVGLAAVLVGVRPGPRHCPNRAHPRSSVAGEEVPGSYPAASAAVVATLAVVMTAGGVAALRG
jgi:hypothetical protein